ncbi:MAG: hypothetical protein ACRYG7_40830 [Janthinobacterium lividum]
MRTISFRLAFAAVLVSAAGLAAQAAPQATARQQAPAQTGPGQRGADMLKELNLTADQQAKVEALLQEQRAQRSQRPSGPPTDAEREAMQASRATLDTKLKAILTPEQYTKYQAMRPQRGARPAAPSN